MPAIEDFVKRHGPGARPISEIVKTWNNSRLAKDLADAVVVGGALAADVIQGDGFRDQVPEEVRDAVANLAREPKNWGAYDEARLKIQEVLNNDLINNSKESSNGWISKYKGQLGEDLFNKQFDGANLANNPNQPGYDVFRGPEDGREYIQVKLYSDPNQVLEKMKEVQHRVLNEQILGEDGRVPVRAINWAVPDDKVEEVRRLVAETPELAQISVYPIGITTERATQLFHSGVDAVGAEGLENFGNLFGELSSGVTSAVALQSAFVGFLWWKGQREAEEAKSQVVDTVFTSTAGFTAALATEEIAGSLIFGGPLGFVLGFTTRQIVRRALSSRREFVKHNEAVNKELELLLAKLATC